jgi:hypothetical protein
MKKYFTILFPAGAILFVILMAGFGGSDLRNPGGAPAGYTNSPGDGQNCTHCMGGTAMAVTGWITSDIPVSGYIPGSTYIITVTATGSGNKGFQASPQDVQGNLLGTITAGTGNKLVGGGKYVTHNATQTGNPASWNFQWTAPVTGIGEVIFYGSIIVGKLNTKTTTMTVSQSTVGISAQKLPELSIFPNPAHQSFTVFSSVAESGNVKLDLLDNKGGVVRNLLKESVNAGEFTRTFSIDDPAGLYFLRIIYGEQARISKIIIQ